MKRAAIYLRQSVSREDSISLELQESSCRSHCTRNGYAVVMVEADPGISGRTFKRPAVQRVMDAMERHEIDVIVLWKWSRLSRSRRDWAIAEDRVAVAGGTIESSTEDIDITTSHGRFARGMMVEMAAFESERIGDQWKEAHARRIAMGLPANGKPRFGYQRSGPGFEPDPQTGPVLAEAYRRYISGESVHTLTRWLNGLDVPTSPGFGRSGGTEWTRRTIQRILDSGFGAGFITVHGQLLPGAHEPVITPDEWEAYKTVRERRRGRSGSTRSQYVLSGLVRCACGSPMTAGQYGHAHVPKFRCTASAEAGRHPGGYVTTKVLEAEVLRWLQEIAGDLAGQTDVQVKLTLDRERGKEDVKRLDERISRAEAALSRLTVSYAEGEIELPAYQSAAATLQDKRDRLIQQRTEAAARSRALPVSVGEAQRLLDMWDVLPVEQRREALRGMVRYVLVTPQRPRSLVRVVPVWEG